MIKIKYDKNSMPKNEINYGKYSYLTLDAT